MEPALKQRLIGAAVLVAIAVIFLPMLIKGPAPESGVSDISLDLPDTPGSGFETRELPLVTPPARSGASVIAPAGEPGADGALPTVDTRAARDGGAGPEASAAVAAGNYAVSFGSYASQADAQKVLEALHGAGLPAFREAVKSGDRTLHRVRIGPYQTRAEAESARIDSARVRNDVDAKVVVLDAAADSSAPASTASRTPDKPAAVATAPTPKPASEPATKPEPKPEPPKPVVATPKPAAPAPAPAPDKPAPAAAGVGFVVQLGAFGNQAEAIALRDRARSQGLSAFVEQVRTAEGGTLNRVQVGPVADRAAADQLKAQVASKLGIPGFVRSHP